MTDPVSREGLDRRWAQLMAAGQSGDRGAYAALLGELLPYLRRFAGRQLRAPEEIEDAVQDILLSLHQARRTYDPTRPFRPWLATIARRRIADRLQLLGRRSVRESELVLDDETLWGEVPNTEENVFRRRDVAAAVASLPQGQRQAIELLKVQGWSLKEASTMTGMSTTALKVATHRAVKSLRKRLGGGHG
ncbi:MAG: sigma-70 family RNA polymerase sigma factor [Alphaproteobacteria bacterium]|nr:sigma-70 family RNA polymerase sigma factor [Alphaproteobacteria bacterium]